jgi:hypothetical protein
LVTGEVPESGALYSGTSASQTVATYGLVCHFYINIFNGLFRYARASGHWYSFDFSKIAAS